MTLHLLFGTVLLALSLVFGGCASNPVTGKSQLALFQVSTQEEIGIGRKTFPTALQQMGGAYPDPALQAYVTEVGLSLARVSQRPELPWEFRVVNDSSPNAFALPGGFVAITRGLLVGLENEAELAAVLGHEIGHVTARHAVQGMQRGSLLNLGLTVLSGVTAEAAYGPLAQQAGQLAANLLDKSYSREQERESDLLGIDYLAAANYDPQGAVQLQDFFVRKIEGGASPHWAQGLFRTHPFSAERLRDNRQYVSSRYPELVGNPRYRLGPQSYAAATQGLRAVSAGYELYDQAKQLEQTGAERQAVSTYLQAAAAAPEEALILTGLGMAYLRADDPRSARLHLAKAVKLNGDYYYARMGLGYALLRAGEPARAAAQLETSMSLLPTLQGAFLLAEALEKSGKGEQAIPRYRSVVEADPKGKLGLAAAERLRALEGR